MKITKNTAHVIAAHVDIVKEGDEVNLPTEVQSRHTIGGLLIGLGLGILLAAPIQYTNGALFLSILFAIAGGYVHHTGDKLQEESDKKEAMK